MGMIPEDFYETFVHGNYEDFLQDTGCVRRAFNAAVSASHLADHYFNYYKIYDPSKIKSFKTIGDFVEYISNKTAGSFKDIRSISNAYKHLYEDPKRGVNSSISSTGSIESIAFVSKKSEVSMLEEVWLEDSKAIETRSKVFYTRKDGQQIELLTTLDTVIKFWEKLLL